jgi:hypothetical protein
MKQREDRLLLGPDDQYILRGLALEEGDSLDIRVGNNWVAGYVHYEESDGNWYCDSGIMSIPLFDGREARFRLETVHHKQGDEKALARDDLDEIDGEDGWDIEQFEDEERY